MFGTVRGTCYKQAVASFNVIKADVAGAAPSAAVAAAAAGLPTWCERSAPEDR